MAMTKCSECGHDVSTLAAACPGCGAPAPKDPPATPSEFVKSLDLNQKMSTSSIVWGLIFVAVLLFLGGTAAWAPTAGTLDAPLRCSDEGDAVCIFHRGGVGLIVACKMAVEQQAKYDFHWVDGINTLLFTKVAWSDQAAGVLSVYGDAIEMKNGYGAMLRTSYACTYDMKSKRAVAADVWPGRMAP